MIYIHGTDEKISGRFMKIYRARKNLAGLLVLVLFSVCAYGADFNAEKWKSVKIWPGLAPGEKGSGESGEIKTDPTIQTDGTYSMRIFSCGVPTISVFKPEKEKDSGKCIIIFPGGAYNVLAIHSEGWLVADYLKRHGITAVVLKYRVPRRKGLPKHTAALQDAQRTVSFVRSSAEELGINPHKIGVLGFSAGGHLAVMTATCGEHRSYKAEDDIDKVSCRPDYAIPVYPAYILDNKGNITSEIVINKETPQMCFIHGDRDSYTSLGSVELYKQLKKYKIDSELHIYARAEHGFGMKVPDRPWSTWIDRVIEWLEKD